MPRPPRPRSFVDKQLAAILVTQVVVARKSKYLGQSHHRRRIDMGTCCDRAHRAQRNLEWVVDDVARGLLQATAEIVEPPLDQLVDIVANRFTIEVCHLRG